VNHGGTGQSSFTAGNLLYGAGTASQGIQSVATTSVTCSGSVSCTGFTVIGSSAVPQFPILQFSSTKNSTGTANLMRTP
jgi:hypothetical protein